MNALENEAILKSSRVFWEHRFPLMSFFFPVALVSFQGKAFTQFR